MRAMSGSPRRPVAALLALALSVALVAPVLAQEASPPGRGPKPKPSKAPATPVTLTGRVASSTDADGHNIYTITVGSELLQLSAGPHWWWGDADPLAASVGKSVTIVGERREGSTEVDVETVDGERLREPGRPPWAGGWKAVGEKHPGWSAEKAAFLAERMQRWAERMALKALRWAEKHPGREKPGRASASPTP